MLARPAAERVEWEPVRSERDGLHAGDAGNVIDVRVQILEVRLPGLGAALVDQPAEEMQSDHAAIGRKRLQFVVAQVLRPVGDAASRRRAHA